MRQAEAAVSHAADHVLGVDEDVSMPVLDGLEATRLIKACAATRDARVIAYTGSPTLMSL
jgi:CheY-like chemotaxis protein